jgi:hypothetical protein
MADTTAPEPKRRRSRGPIIDADALLLARTLAGGPTHREVAEACTRAGTTVDYANFGRAERTGYGIGRSKVRAIAGVLGVDPTQILAGHPSAKAFKEAVASTAGIDVGKIREALTTAGRAA